MSGLSQVPTQRLDTHLDPIAYPTANLPQLVGNFIPTNDGATDREGAQKVGLEYEVERRDHVKAIPTISGSSVFSPLYKQEL